MCNLSKGIEERGIERGVERGVLMSIQNLMDTMELTVEQAMAALKVPETERDKYQKLIKNQ